MNDADKTYLEELIVKHTAPIKASIANQSTRLEGLIEKQAVHFEDLMIKQSALLTEQFQNHVTAISENFDLKIGLIAEGHQTLRHEMHDIKDELKEDIGLCHFKIDTVNDKIDALATNLKAHRLDTEAHQIYQVKE